MRALSRRANAGFGTGLFYTERTRHGVTARTNDVTVQLKVPISQGPPPQGWTLNCVVGPLNGPPTHQMWMAHIPH